MVIPTGAERWFKLNNPGLSLIERTSVFSVLVAFLTGVLSSFSPGLGVVILLLQVLFAAMVILFFLVKTVLAITRRRGKAAVAFLTAALVIGYVDIFPCASFFSYVGDFVHLTLLYPYYVSRLKAKRLEFPWGGSGMVGANQTERTLLYDLDETLKSKPSREEFKAGGSTIAIDRKKLFGNFFVVERTFY